MTGKDWAGLGAAGAGGILPLLFGGKDSTAGPIDQLSKEASGASDNAKAFKESSDDVLGPVADYLKAVAGGDRQALIQATAPQRGRVIDQYSTAKKAIAEFTPRGGGQAASLNKLQGQEASDLADTTNTARTEGVQAATGLGAQLAGLGISEQQLASGDLSSIIQTLSAQDANKGNALGGLGQALGSIASFLFI